MPANFNSIRADLEKAERGRKMLDDAVLSFQAAVAVQQDRRSEIERSRAHFALDAWFDAIATGYRELARGR
jgi:hypothetical protein